jgi:ABC-type transport system substrate-binding protein
MPGIGTILQSDLARIGVKVNLQGVTGSTVLSTALSGNFESVLSTFGDQPDPQLRKDIWQPGGALHYWRRSLQPAQEGGVPDLAAMTASERRTYDLFAQAEALGNQAQRRKLYNKSFHFPADVVSRGVKQGSVLLKVGQDVLFRVLSCLPLCGPPRHARSFPTHP